jgi:hypothetical protein
MPTIYEYTYFTQQKARLDAALRQKLNTTLSSMRMGLFNTSKQVAGNGQTLVKNKVNMAPDVARNTEVLECRIDGHWRIFYYKNPGGNITALCIGHLDPNSRLMEP